MVGLSQSRRYTYAEYLELERESGEKHELIDGEVRAMAGGTPRHAKIISNLGGVLHASLGDGPCQAYSSELKVRAVQPTFATYPDATVVCGPIERAPDDRNAVTNPTVIVEVLSPSTESHDRGRKFLRYQRIPTLRHYLLVSVDEVLVEHYERRDNTWIYRVHARGGRIELGAVGVAIDVDALYRNLPEESA